MHAPGAADDGAQQRWRVHRLEQALTEMTNVTLKRLPGREIDVTIETDDPDLVDIVREIAWEYDPAAVQHSLLLADVS